MKILKIICLLLVAILTPLNIWAQDDEVHPILSDRFYAEAGVFIPQKDIKFGADGDINDDIDFGQTFDFNDNQATFFFNGEWRWNKKWRLTGEYFAVNNKVQLK